MKNKLILSFIVSVLSFHAVGSGHSYTLKQFAQDSIKDTKELYKHRPEFKGAYFLDLLENGESRHKVGASIPVAAWKFVTLDPVFVYAPDSASKKGEYGISFSVRLNRVPLGDNFTVGDMFDAECPEWLQRFYAGPFLTQNLSTGKFGFGIQSGVKF